jgi:hypothetical protein
MPDHMLDEVSRRRLRYADPGSATIQLRMLGFLLLARLACETGAPHGLEGLRWLRLPGRQRVGMPTRQVGGGDRATPLRTSRTVRGGAMSTNTPGDGPVPESLDRAFRDYEASARERLLVERPDTSEEDRRLAVLYGFLTGAELPTAELPTVEPAPADATLDAGLSSSRHLRVVE